MEYLKRTINWMKKFSLHFLVILNLILTIYFYLETSSINEFLTGLILANGMLILSAFALTFVIITFISFNPIIWIITAWYFFVKQNKNIEVKNVSKNEK